MPRRTATPLRRRDIRRRPSEVSTRHAPIWRLEHAGGKSRRPDQPAPAVGMGVGGLRPATPGARVLVVDDEAAIRLVCRVNLVLAGLDVIEAADGAGALEVALRERPDLVLLDVMMPDLNGWDVARQLRANEATRDIPIVFLTARATDVDRRRGFDAGGVGYIVKPFDPLTLGDHVQKTLKRLARGEREQLRHEILNR